MVACRYRDSRVTVMILSDTIKVKYKLDTKGKNTVEMAKLLRDYGVEGSYTRLIHVALSWQCYQRTRNIIGKY